MNNKYEEQYDKMYAEWLIKQQNVREIMKSNCEGYDLIFSKCRSKCAQCGFSLKPIESHNYIATIGDVCDICHTMYFTVKSRKHFVDAQAQYDDEQKKKISMKTLNNRKDWN